MKNFIRSFNTLNKYSRHITQPKQQGASQAMLSAVGLTREDMKKPQIGISSVWYEGNPCNYHLNDLGKFVKNSVESDNLIGLQFNTIGVSDGISMGTSGMSYSLQSREIIADSIESVMNAQWYDANVSIPGCDKNMPGCLMAMGRVNRPSIMVYGGTINSGCTSKKKDIDIVDAFQSYGEYISGNITEDERIEIVENACPGAGACGGMYTANTMAVAIETLGMTLPNSSSNPAMSESKIKECKRVGKTIRNLLEKDIKPRDIMTRKSFENAMTMITVMGGSTNAVLHIIAIAHSVGIKLSINDFQRISDRIPLLADLKPSGKYLMKDIFQYGGTSSILKYLIDIDLIDGECLTVTGKSLRENLENVKSIQEYDQDIIRTINNPLKNTGHIQILKGNLAPEGSVAKISGKEGEFFKGSAIVYESEEDMLTGLNNKEIKKGHVIIIRNEGPIGGPGMPEMLTPTSAIIGAGLGDDVAMITDGRFSGGSHGFIIGHVTPESYKGGPISLIENGDIININSITNTINTEVSDRIMNERMKNWKKPDLKVKSGTLYKYTKLVNSASNGCITDM